jgi:hypothetical protein
MLPYYHRIVGLKFLVLVLDRWFAFRRQEIPSARDARSTLATRSPSTRLVRLPSSLKVSEDTMPSKKVSVVKQSPSSGRRPRLPRRSSLKLSALNANARECYHSSDARLSSSVRRRVERMKAMVRSDKLLVVITE